ncbi:hypothetical protein HPB49_025771 [Dermacentor silvarum]|nr:hypothetical protein HPB49_025771 [Dermacentor silvarum]
MHVKKSTIVNCEEWRVSSSKMMLHAIRKAASLQAEWYSYDLEEGFEGADYGNAPQPTRDERRPSVNKGIQLDLRVQTGDERQASDLLNLNTLEIPSTPPLPVSVHQVPSEGMSRGVIYGCTPDETS